MVMRRPIPEGVDPEKFLRVAEAVETILSTLDISQRDDTYDTPWRVAKYWLTEMNLGIGADPKDVLTTTFEEQHPNELIAVHDLPFVSCCSHHLLPVTGFCDIGYIPDGNGVIGLSKLARLVDTLARQPTMQESLTQAVADAVEDILKPKGVMVVIQATHTCMTLRGIKATGSLTTTSAVRGVFLDPSRGARAEFLSLVGRR